MQARKCRQHNAKMLHRIQNVAPRYLHRMGRPMRGAEPVYRHREGATVRPCQETPRLLLNSGNLANSSDQVGRNFMVHSGPIVYGRFEQPLDS